MNTRLAWQDIIIIIGYLIAMVVIAWRSSRRRSDSEEYFLASRSLPWFAVGISVIATLFSSLTYLSDPGEVWQSGVTYFFAKSSAVLLEMFIVLFVLIPFLMRYRFTSVYEYLGHRFGMTARTVGVILFTGLVITWMGFVVLAMARTLSQVSGFSLEVVIFSIGLLATAYTSLGGYRAVVWTEVAQVGLMLFGCLATIGFVAYETGSHPWDWFLASEAYLTQHQRQVTFASADPFVRVTILSAGASMFFWHLCTHASNQMTVQRYFSSTDARAARRSFVIAGVLSIFIYQLLALVGLAILFYFTQGFAPLDLNPEMKKQADMIFPTFMVQVLPPGLSGAVLTAILAAAMSTIDSAINSLSTVLSIERNRSNPSPQRNVWFARGVTFLGGAGITLMAFGLDRLTLDRNIVEMMPRTFNCFLVPMGGLFLAGIFFPFIGQPAALLSTGFGFLATVGISYARELFGLSKDISFTWVIPCSLGIMMIAALVLGAIFPRPTSGQIKGWTWWT